MQWLSEMPALDSVHCWLYILHLLGDKFTKRYSTDSVCYPELQWVTDWQLLWVCFHMYNTKTFLTEAFKSLTRYFTCCFDGWCHFPIFDNCWYHKKGCFHSDSALSQNWKFTLFNLTEHPNFCGYFLSEPSGFLDLILSLPILLARSASLWALWTPVLETQMPPLLDILWFLFYLASAGQQEHAAQGAMITLPVLRPTGPTHWDFR